MSEDVESPIMCKTIIVDYDAGFCLQTNIFCYISIRCSRVV